VPVVLYRVDERLIHGQVVIGWGHELRPDRYVVVEDELASSAWEQDLYRLGAPGAEVEFLTTEEAHDALHRFQDEEPRTVVLTRDLGTMARLAGGGRLEGRTVNVGGLHSGPGRRQVLTYLHLTEADIEEVRALVNSGVKVQARDLPDASRIDLVRLLDLA